MTRKRLSVSTRASQSGHPDPIMKKSRTELSPRVCVYRCAQNPVHTCSRTYLHKSLLTYWPTANKHRRIFEALESTLWLLSRASYDELTSLHKIYHSRHCTLKFVRNFPSSWNKICPKMSCKSFPWIFFFFFEEFCINWNSFSYTFRRWNVAF